MKNIQLKSLSMFIVLCLLLTGIFSTVLAEPESEENLKIIDQPLEPAIEPAGASECFHSWYYMESPFDDRHNKICSRCGTVIEEPHEYTYVDNGDTHYTRCTKCPLNRRENHVADSFALYYHDGKQGHHQKCKLCGGNTIISPHDLTYSGDSDGQHQAWCSKCNYTFWEDHEGDGIIRGSDPYKYEKCKKCNAYIYLPCTHSNKTYSYADDTFHLTKCTACGKQLGFEPHSYEKVDNGPDNHKLICKYCRYEKSTEPHTFQWVSDGANGHHKVCTGCGRVEENTTHDLTYTSQGYDTHSVKCQTCGYTSTQSHNWDGVTVNDPYPHQHCIQCGQASRNTDCQHNNINAEEHDNTFHMRVCADCSKELGVELHEFEVTSLGGGKYEYYCPICGFSKITSGPDVTE